MSSGRRYSRVVHLVMDLIPVVVYTFLVLSVNSSSAWYRPYYMNARALRQTLRFSRRPAIWRVVPLGMERKKTPQPSASEIDVKFSSQNEDNKIEDQESSASENGHESHGRVLIKVFRGPEDEHHFAKHGFFVKHPEDE